jgi:hypothetical protein
MNLYSDENLAGVLANSSNINVRNIAFNLLIYRSCTDNNLNLLDQTLSLIKGCHRLRIESGINLSMLELLRTGNMSLIEKLSPYYSPSPSIATTAFIHACKTGQLKSAQWVSDRYTVELQKHNIDFIISSARYAQHEELLRWLMQKYKI